MVNELVLRRVGCQRLDQFPGFVLGHASEPVHVQRVDEQNPPAAERMADDRRARLFRLFAVQVLLRIASIEPDACQTIVAAVKSRHPGKPALHRAGSSVAGGAHVGERRAALVVWNLFGMEDRETGGGSS